MPKRNSDNATLYGILVSLIIFSAMALAWSELSDQAPQAVANEYEASEYAESAKARTEATCANLQGVRFSECVIQIEQSERENHRAQKDLKAQRYMAIWAFVMAFASIITAGIAAIGLVWIKRTFEETREAVRAADDAVAVTRSIGESQVRAYVQVNDIACNISADDGRAFISGQIKNFGLSPARDFEIGVRLIQKIKKEDFRSGDAMCGIEDIPSNGQEEFLTSVDGQFITPNSEMGRIIAAVVVFGYDVFGKEIIEQSVFISSDNVVNTGKFFTRFKGRAPANVKIDLIPTFENMRKKKRQD